MNFTLRQLEYAVAVARHLNFGEAAKSCYVSQPSLSAQVGQLETALGVMLFERGGRKVVVTPVGLAFTERARVILRRAADLEDVARASHTPLSSELRLGVIPTIAPYLLPEALPALKAHHPACRLYLAERQTDLLVRQLHDGELDVLLLALEADLGVCETLELFRDPFLVAVPDTHDLARGSGVLPLAELPRPDLLLLEEGHCLSRQIVDTCGLARDADAGDFRASSLVTLVQMVAMGMGITLLPRIAQGVETARNPGVVVRPLAEDAYRTIGLAWRPGCPRREEFELLGSYLRDPDSARV